MRFITFILIAIILLLQYPLWLGKGGWLKVLELDRQLKDQEQLNLQSQARNSALDAEVRDLKQGTEAIEERARSELGMVKRDEIFFQLAGRQVKQEPESSSTDNASQAGVHQ